MTVTAVPTATCDTCGLVAVSPAIPASPFATFGTPDTWYQLRVHGAAKVSGDYCSAACVYAALVKVLPEHTEP